MASVVGYHDDGYEPDIRTLCGTVSRVASTLVHTHEIAARNPGHLKQCLAPKSGWVYAGVIRNKAFDVQKERRSNSTRRTTSKASEMVVSSSYRKESGSRFQLNAK